MENDVLQNYAPNGICQPRLCDYVVDPIWVRETNAGQGNISYRCQERFEEWCREARGLDCEVDKKISPLGGEFSSDGALDDLDQVIVILEVDSDL